MTRRHPAIGIPGVALFFLAVVHLPADALSADLTPAIVEGFDRYVKATETRIESELKDSGRFLYVDRFPEGRRMAALADLKRGDVFMERLKTVDPNGREIKASDSLIHHWMGAVFIPGTTLASVLALAQDYDRHQDIYGPEIVRSGLISRNGNDFKTFYRLRKKKIITVTLNTEHEVRYFPVDSTHCHSRSYTTRIQEVEDADESTERQKPVGQDSGFLWRLYSYWRFEQKDDGVYLECESISLTRNIPKLISFIVKPFVTEIPKESLRTAMGATRRVLLEKAAADQSRY